MFALRARTPLPRASRTLFARFESTGAPVSSEPTASAESTASGDSVENASSASASTLAPPRRRRYNDVPRPRITRTHFLTIPLYKHSPDLQERVSAFRESVIASNLTGLTKDTVIPRFPHFLELRLGNLNIEGFKSQVWLKRRPFRGQSTELTRAEQTPTPIAEVLEVLNGLRAPIQEILTANGGDGALHVPLGNLRPLLHGGRRSFNPQKVNILFLEPSDVPAAQPLRAINDLVFKRFEEAGMWVDTHRPSTLSMTFANVRYTSGNEVKPYDQRVPFDILALYESEAYKALSGGPPAAAEGQAVDAATPRPIMLGEGIARSLHLIPIPTAEPEGVSEAERTAPKKADYALEF